MKSIRLSILGLLLFPLSLFAADTNYDQLRNTLTTKLPGIEIQSIKPSGVAGLLELTYGSQIVYATPDGRYIVDGDIIDLKNQVNLTETSKETVRVSMLNELGDKNMLVYKPEKTKHYITVFTDVDCPYCQRLHNEMNDYLQGGVEVRYLFLPFKGQESYNKSVSVWCSDNQQKAMDLAKQGKAVENKTCDNPIKDHMALSKSFGIRGTPAIVLETGQLLPGYKPAKEVVKYLDQLKSAH